jgi:hypothetical protein
MYNWYKGKPLDQTEPITDPETGQPMKRYPLRLNTPRLACDIHRDMARGKIEEDTLFLKAKVSRKGRITGDKADLIEALINDGVWRPSRGGTLLSESLLCSNIYGGTAFKLSWEPWRRHLPYGLAARAIRNPSLIYPQWDPVDNWRFLEVWYGFMISPQEAMLRYNVDVPEQVDEVLYMEHWTNERFRITVNGRVPRMRRFVGDEEGYPLAGENRWGFIPFYYSPHERADDPWGFSQIEGQEELCREVNARQTNVSDYFRALRPDVLYATDIRGKNLRVVEVNVGGRTLKVLDMGDTPPMQNAKSPSLESLPTVDIPDTYASHPQTLRDWEMEFSRLSPALFGKDDTQSGRITGIAVAQRLWSTTSHTDTERLNMSTCKTVFDTDVVRLFGMEPFREDLQLLLDGRGSTIGIPEVDEEDGWSVIILQTWPDPLPLDKEVDHRIRTDKLRANAMSIDRYLGADNVPDVEEEKRRIQEWSEKTRPQGMFGGGGGFDGSGNQDQG